MRNSYYIPYYYNSKHIDTQCFIGLYFVYFCTFSQKLNGEKIKIKQVINTGLSDLEQSLSDYPSLIYDGPFSDHVGKKDAVDDIKEDMSTKESSSNVN